MDNEAGVQRLPSHAEIVAGIAGAFEAVQQHHVTHRRFHRPLRNNKNLRIGIGTNQTAIFRKWREIVPARPEIAEDCEEVRITYYRFKWPHGCDRSR
jgi:hypothetical protein